MMTPAEIRALRAARGWTLDQAAAAVHADRQTWHRWERGDQRPRGAYLAALERLARETEAEGNQTLDTP